MSGGTGPGPIVGLEREPDGPLLGHNTLRLEGWALSPAGIANVTVRIGEREVVPAFGLPTPAWHAGLPDWPGAERARYELELDTSRWERGNYAYEIFVSDRGGRSASLSGVAELQPYEAPPIGDEEVRAALAAGRPALWCEVPDLFDDATGEAPLEVSGWAASPAGIREISITIDGRTRLATTTGVRRPELEELLDGWGDGCGFGVRLSLDECAPGWHELTVVAVAGDGLAVGFERKVNCLAEEARENERERQREEDDPAARGVIAPAVDPASTLRYRWAANLAAGAEVLDVGCGGGWGTALLAERAERAVGVDVSAAAVADAERQHGGAAEFREADARRLPFSDGAFDLVVCFEALEWLPDPEPALDEMLRALRPGGILLVAACNRGAYPPGNPMHMRELSSDELSAALAGRFANVAVHRQHSFLASVLGDEGTLLLGDADKTFAANLGKTFGGEPGDELFAVAAASDGELPPAPAAVAVGRPVDPDEPRLLRERWRASAREAELEAAAARARLRLGYGRRPEEPAASPARRAALEAEVAELKRRLAGARNQRVALEGSRSWRLAKPLRFLRQLARSKAHLR